MKKSISLVILGGLNLLHFGSHFIQLIQSLLLIRVNHSHSCSHNHEESLIDLVLHNPYFNLLWIVVAIYTIYAGIEDFKHHRREINQKK